MTDWDFSADSKGTLVILNEAALATEVMAFLPKANEHLCLAMYGSAELCFTLYLSPLCNFGWAQLQKSDMLTEQFLILKFCLHNRFGQYFVLRNPASLSVLVSIPFPWPAEVWVLWWSFGDIPAQTRILVFPEEVRDLKTFPAESFCFLLLFSPYWKQHQDLISF